MPEAGNARDVGAQIEALLGELDRTADASMRAKTEELIGLVVELYGAGLERILELTYEAGGDEFIRRLSDDEFVASLLILHGLHPVDVEARVNDALEKVRPYLGSHAGGVEFLGVDESGVARLRLQGSCDGCPSSTVTVKTAIEGAIAEAAPDVVAVDVEGMIEPESPQPSLLQITPLETSTSSSNGSPRTGSSTWAEIPESVVPGDGGTTVVERNGVALLLSKVGDELYAYRNSCSACTAPLDLATLDGSALTCASCRAIFDVQRAGRSLEDPAVHLHPLPLLRSGGTWKVALPSGALQ